MPRPIVYYGNHMTSGTLSGSTESTDNPVREVADGSINLGYAVTTDVSPTAHSGQVDLVLNAAVRPAAFILPRCSLVSGLTLLLQSMDDVGGTNLATVVSADISTLTTFYKAEISSGETPRAVWRLLISGVSGLVPAKVHESQLAVTRTQFARSPEVSVSRIRVRQFTRIPVPGGQPFVKKDGPRLRRYTYNFVLVSGATENNPMRDFVDAVEGGEAFTTQDDLGDCYWAELLGNEINEGDSAGVSRWATAIQEIRVQE